MPEVWGDSGCEYVNYVGYSPDCVDRAVLDDSDGCPEGTLPSVPVCVVTDDMTYQEKIEALSGTMYDYDDVCDNLPEYFDCNKPDDWEELSGFDGPVECGVCCGPCQTDVSDGGTIGSVTCHIVLCSLRNRILPELEANPPPGMQTNLSRLLLTTWERPNHTRPSLVLDLVTISPTSRTHRHRMIPK